MPSFSTPTPAVAGSAANRPASPSGHRRLASGVDLYPSVIESPKQTTAAPGGPPAASTSTPSSTNQWSTFTSATGAVVGSVVGAVVGPADRYDVATDSEWPVTVLGTRPKSRTTVRSDPAATAASTGSDQIGAPGGTSTSGRPSNDSGRPPAVPPRTASAVSPKALSSRTRTRRPPTDRWTTWRSVWPVNAGGAENPDASCGNGDAAHDPTQAGPAARATDADSRATAAAAAVRLIRFMPGLLSVGTGSGRPRPPGDGTRPGWGAGGRRRRSRAGGGRGDRGRGRRRRGRRRRRRGRACGSSR